MFFPRRPRGKPIWGGVGWVGWTPPDWWGERSLRSEPSSTALPPRDEAAELPSPSLRGGGLSEQAERARLAESGTAESPWRLWGPYLAGRQWGTVGEDCSGDGDAGGE